MPDKQDWETVGFLLSSEIRQGVLRTLSGQRCTPSQISTVLGQPISHVSRALGELQSRKLAVCLTPERKKGRLYQITSLGETVLRELERLRTRGEKP
ncbi:MAG TPA: ArsR family transcriptional regulator [Thermoleophilia bacterium]|nr:ArsR family transcriptional regulator [Thermoleophilia bacterium]